MISKQSINSIENHQTNDKKITLKTITQITPNVEMLVSILEPFARGAKTPTRFFRDLFFGISWGVSSRTDVGFLWGTLGLMLSIVWQMLVASLLPKSKIPEQPIAQTTHSKKNKQGFKHILMIINPNKTCFAFVALQSRVSPKPQVLKQ